MTSIADQFRLKFEPANWIKKAPEKIKALVNKIKFTAKSPVLNKRIRCWSLAVKKDESCVYVIGFDLCQTNYQVFSINVDMKKRLVYACAVEGWLKLDIDDSETEYVNCINIRHSRHYSPEFAAIHNEAWIDHSY
jgi:hypothetical protein